jgi:hypothetical protein
VCKVCGAIEYLQEKGFKVITVVIPGIPQMAVCKDCGELEKFTPDGFGLNYYQSIGECGNCHKPTYYTNGNPTKTVLIFRI